MGDCFDLPEFEREGFAMQPSLLSCSEVDDLIRLLEACLEESRAVEHRRGGVRDLMKVIPALRSVASHANVRSIVEDVLGLDAILVRATLFDKTHAANWKVPWHQDITIAVKQRHHAEGYGPWSIKAGVQHVQPPTSVLNRMLTVRIHLDPCPASNGALRVMPGTHRLGRLDQNQVARFVDDELAVTCTAEAGGALLMRPLLLHASSPSLVPVHRRVLHFDFATGGLADGITWQMS